MDFGCISLPMQTYHVDSVVPAQVQWPIRQVAELRDHSPRLRAVEVEDHHTYLDVAEAVGLHTQGLRIQEAVVEEGAVVKSLIRNTTGTISTRLP